ncbi:MAG: polyprenyl diphosphate synthase, partial [Nocardioidaceae bacterium]
MRTPGEQRVRDVVYGLYERRLARSFTPEQIPRHIGVIIDGNRRWARAAGDPVSSGHKAGANKISEFLEWCDEVGVRVVTVWMLSTDNLARPAEELEPLLRIIENTVDELTAIGRWQIHPVGALDLLPAPTAEALKAADAATHKIDGMLVNVAVGYGGRRELADAVRSLLLEEAAKGISIEELAELVDVEHIAEHLYTKGQPDPD